MSEPANESQTTSEKSPRFSWPMRLFLGFLLLDMIGQSLISLAPCSSWADELGMRSKPKRLPSQKEMRELAENAGRKNPTPVSDRVMASMDSVWEFFKPWPPKKVRRKLTSWENSGKYALCWISTRLRFYENVTGTYQSWQMFSPNAYDGVTVSRAVLHYGDNSSRVYRFDCDPADLTNYHHWSPKKILSSELDVPHDNDTRLGICNYLKHRYPKNSRGSPLTKIYIYNIKYKYPAPDDDYEEVLRSQSGPPNWNANGPDFAYDVNTGVCSALFEDQRKAIQLRLNKARESAR